MPRKERGTLKKREIEWGREGGGGRGTACVCVCVCEKKLQFKKLQTGLNRWLRLHLPLYNYLRFGRVLRFY